MMSFLPATVAAEFDKCARVNGEWAGFDQAKGESYGYAVAHSGSNVYIAGRASGSLSFGTSDWNGDYHDHLGSYPDHKTAASVAADAATPHHATGSVEGAGYTDASLSRHGMDNFIYKISATGVPLSVYGFDITTSDGKSDGTSENGQYGYAYPYQAGGFEGQPDKVMVVGSFRGSLKFPKGATQIELLNRKDSYDGYAAKIDMATNEVVWASSENITDGRIRTGVTTAAGHVIAGFDGSKGGRLTKFNGDTGIVVWSKEFGKDLSPRDAKYSSYDENVYVTGRFKAKDSTAYSPAQATTSSCEDGKSTSAVVAAFDVQPADGPVAKWVTVIGCGGGSTGTFVQSNFLYVVGYNKEPSVLAHDDGSSAAQCTMTGEFGGYLVKLNKDNGKCVWAKDVGGARKVVANYDFVWAMVSTSNPFQFDATHDVQPSGYKVIMAKFRASDGFGMWGAMFGGAGSARDYAYDMDMSSTGPVVAGYSSSGGAVVGAVTATALQMAAAEEAGGSGPRAMFVAQVSTTDAVPSCLTCAAGGDISDTATYVKDNFCYSDSLCIANGEFSPTKTCYRCDSATSKKNLTGPITDNHCFIDDKCVAAGANRPSYASYNSASVCETCTPMIDTKDWSIESGYFHDATYQLGHDCSWTTSGRGGFDAKPGPCAPNNYGILFTRNTNGCQVLPDVPMPPSSRPTGAMGPEIKAALVNPTVGGVAAVGARLTNAIFHTGSAGVKDDTQIVSAWYSGDVRSCKKVTISGVDKSTAGPCKFTPAAHADEMADNFETNMHYGHSIARIKVQQALAILHNDFSTDTVTATHSDIKMDIVAHMLIPVYQGAIKAAYDMDTAADKVAAKADGAAYWGLIKANVLNFNANDKARLNALFDSAASGTFNYCEAKTLLHRNLPGSSMLMYGQKDHSYIGDRHAVGIAHLAVHEPLPTATTQHVPHKNPVDSTKYPGAPGSSHGLVKTIAKGERGGGNPVGQFQDAVEVVHLQERDVGVLKTAVAGDGTPMVCTFPPPSPPPPLPLPLPPPPLISQEAAILESLKNPDLTDKAKADLEAKLRDVRAQLKELEESKDDSSGLSDGEIAGVAIGAAIGGIVLLLVVGLILRSLLFKEAKPVFTCLEKGDAKAPAKK
jgi:hypothetical protein